jgi:hypothetical protein
MIPDPSARSDASPAGSDGVSAISAIAYGFMGSQALFAALELGVFDALAGEPRELEALVATLHAPVEPLRVLLSTCLTLKLLAWDGARYANSPAAQRFLVRSSRSYVGDYYLRQISPMIYPDMPRVRALLRGEPAGHTDYTTTYSSPEKAEDFIRGQHAGSLGPAILLNRAHHRGGWSGRQDHLRGRRPAQRLLAAGRRRGPPLVHRQLLPARDAARPDGAHLRLFAVRRAAAAA